MNQIQLENVTLTPADRKQAQRALSGLERLANHDELKALLSHLITNQQGQTAPLAAILNTREATNQFNKLMAIQDKVAKVADTLSVYNKVVSAVLTNIREALTNSGDKNELLKYNVNYWLPVLEVYNSNAQELNYQIDLVVDELSELLGKEVPNHD